MRQRLHDAEQLSLAFEARLSGGWIFQNRTADRFVDGFDEYPRQLSSVFDEHRDVVAGSRFHNDLAHGCAAPSAIRIEAKLRLIDNQGDPARIVRDAVLANCLLILGAGFEEDIRGSDFRSAWTEAFHLAANPVSRGSGT